MKKFYFDTSIWLDFFENRDEPNFPKGRWAKELIRKILNEDWKIIISEAVKNELIEIGYPKYGIEEFFKPLHSNLIEVYSNKKQYGKAKDLKNKRKVPFLDALHAILARDSRAVLVTRDVHFKKLLDITKYKKPEELI